MAARASQLLRAMPATLDSRTWSDRGWVPFEVWEGECSARAGSQHAGSASRAGLVIGGRIAPALDLVAEATSRHVLRSSDSRLEVEPTRTSFEFRVGKNADSRREKVRGHIQRADDDQERLVAADQCDVFDRSANHRSEKVRSERHVRSLRVPEGVTEDEVGEEHGCECEHRG